MNKKGVVRVGGVRNEFNYPWSESWELGVSDVSRPGRAGLVGFWIGPVAVKAPVSSRNLAVAMGPFRLPSNIVDELRALIAVITWRCSW
jgi:hypothetical protein